MPMIHGPALPVSIWIKMKRKAVSTFRKERLWKSHGTQPGSQKNYKTRVKASSRASKSLKSKSTAPNLSQSAPDEPLSDLQKQGFSAIHEGKMSPYQPYNVNLRNKVSFDIQPTNPQADITATGHCEYWITTIDLMKYREKNTISSPDDPI